jgi:hypothetical protein
MNEEDQRFHNNSILFEKRLLEGTEMLNYSGCSFESDHFTLNLKTKRGGRPFRHRRRAVADLDVPNTLDRVY